jgi:hypothetical protein
MHSDLFARVRNKNMQIQKTSKAVVGANGTALQVQGIAEVTMSIGKSVVTRDVLICEDLDQMMLIGVDFLKQHNCAIDFQKGTIRVRGEYCKMSLEQESKVCRVMFRESTTIPARSLLTIPCKVENGSTCKGSTGVLELLRKFEERYNIGVLKVVSPLQQVPVKLFNCSDRPKKVFKGSTVGELCLM